MKVKKQTKTIWVRLASREAIDKAMPFILRLIADHPGEMPIALHATTGSQKKQKGWEVRFSEGFNVAEDAVALLEKKFGVENIQVRD